MRALLTFVVFLISTCVHMTIGGAPPTLVQVNLNYRHGDRSSIVPYPNSQWTAETWPQGLGQLSQLGMQQQCELGRFLRSRYDGFLNQNYVRTEISVRSTDYDRTLMSAQSNLACLYPPTGKQLWNQSVLWQPIPVHTPLLASDIGSFPDGCPKYNALWIELLGSKVVKDVERKYKGFIQKVSSLAGFPEADITNVWRVADPLYCEWCHNKTRPAWVHTIWKETNKTMFALIREFANYRYQLSWRTKEMRKFLGGGKMLFEFIDNMQKKIAAGPTNISFPKMHMYSGHDSTVAPLLAAMNVFNNITPWYTACVLVELHQNPSSGEHWVQVLYRNLSRDPGATNIHTEPYELTIPGCDFKCPLEKFISLTSDMRLSESDWSEACNTTTLGRVIKVGAIFVLPVAFVILVLSCGVAIYFKRKRKKQDAAMAQHFKPLLSSQDMDEEDQL